jgi:hypothetical protein
MRSAAIRVRQTLRYGTASTMKGRLVFDANALGDGLRRDLTGLVQAAQQRAKRVAVATYSIQLRPSQSAETQLRAAASRLYYEPFMTRRASSTRTAATTRSCAKSRPRPARC